VTRVRGAAALWALAACGGGTAGTTDGSSGAMDDGGAASAVEDPTEGTPTPLVQSTLWTQVAAPDDPLADHRPAQVTCPLGAWLFEPQGFEVNTGGCNYAMFVQPSRATVVPGATITASLYHYDLIADPPATAHVALLLGERVLWEREVEIPGKANAFAIEVVADETVPAGTPVYFHLHNHGQNTWTLGAVEVEVF
jgi:hypothetical protein